MRTICCLCVETSVDFRKEFPRDGSFSLGQSGDDIVCVFYKQVDFRSVINPPFSGDVHDLAFSFADDILLACVDQASHLRIYRIEKIDEPNEIQ